MGWGAKTRLTWVVAKQVEMILFSTRAKIVIGPVTT
jgi:hypothetical protein